jgi:hypothetical protein
MHCGVLINFFLIEIPFKLSKHSSLVSTLTHLIFFDPETKNSNSYQICKLLTEKTFVGQPIQINEDTLYLFSDGLIYGTFLKDNSVQIFNQDNKMISSIKLEFSSNTKTILPTNFDSLDNVPIVTNGQFIGFLYQSDPTTLIFRIFSLLTGLFIHDESITNFRPFYAVTLNSISKTYWLISPFNENKLEIQQYYFAGSVNHQIFNLDIKKPKIHNSSTNLKIFHNFVYSINFSLIHYIGSQIIPKDISNFNTDKFIILTENYLNSQKKLKDSDSLLLLLTLIMDYHVQASNLPDKTVEKILNIIPKFPTKFAAMIFFNRLNFFMKTPSNHVLTILINLLTNIKYESLLLYAIKMFEKCPYVSKIDFNSPNLFCKIFQNPKSTIKDIGYTISSIAFIHQRILVSATKNYLASQQYIPLTGQSSLIVFNYFLSYFQFLSHQYNIILDSFNHSHETNNNFICFL